uniref:protein downstream neighbor of Son-like n=1 Tax=Erigeron canadensis TaxID=72917 RepID=UPI001CB8F715|nr:protein downstream neighbor of Son-like [Erigeron canadensis]
MEEVPLQEPIKTKAPSQLTSEKSKRKQTMDCANESLVHNADSVRGSRGVKGDHKKSNPSKNPRYIDTRLDDLFPATKNSKRVKMLPEKRNDIVQSLMDVNVTSDHTEGFKRSASKKFTAERQLQGSCTDDVRNTQSNSTFEKCNGSSEVSSGGEKSSGISVDMDKAFIALAAGVPPSISAPADSSKGYTNSASTKYCSEFHVPGLSIPLDLTLKTSMRVVSSSSVNWFHRWRSRGTFNGFGQSNANTTTLCSWVHPQCSFPTSVIKALTSNLEGEGQMDFLSKRQLAWETSFRSLYVMLRKNVSSIFYVCTEQFVAMFINGNGSIESKSACNAYISQSTRTLRSLLKEQDISFTMPLCHSKLEQHSAEELIKYSDIEKDGMGMSKHISSLSDVDNTPESLLAFSGNNNVHGLYDFLLNYRFLLTSLTSSDVPVLYSPVPFDNAALFEPEVKCQEVRRIDDSTLLLKESSTTTEPNQGSESTSYNSIEIRDPYLPPWMIKGVCEALTSNGSDFEASFVIEAMSVGLNIAIDMVCQKVDDKVASDESLPEKHSSFGITNTIISPQMSHAFLKSLKYSDHSYTAFLSPV